MRSKYEEFWRSVTPKPEAAIAEAAHGGAPEIDCSDIRPLGNRASWAGSASVVGGAVLTSSMAHMVSLARIVASAGMCLPWEYQSFTFTMTPAAVLRVRTRRAALRTPPGDARRAMAAHTRGIADGVVEAPLDADAACSTIHEVIADLPRYTSPRDVPFANGLYFFFEEGETSSHGEPRITRIGNHPNAQDRLVGRLADHYRTRRDAKNGSVFRRYVGGALLRRDRRHACLEPGPGRGHWELAKGHECGACAPYEGLVTERLMSSFSFTCVRIDDRLLRNRLERALIASVAQCTVCRPSSGWLGMLAYSAKVHASGLWNSDGVDAPGIGAGDLATFQRLAAPWDGTRADLADTLLLIPCSAGKRGKRRLDVPVVTMADLLGADAGELLAEGRAAAFARAGIDMTSDAVAALARYSGQPYATPGVIDGLLGAMARGLHVGSSRVGMASSARRSRSRTTRLRCSGPSPTGGPGFPGF